MGRFAELISATPGNLWNVEIVERKGQGHPDTLADAIAEEIAQSYSHYCMREHGLILHHNVDKLYIGGGWLRGTPNPGHKSFSV